jgi:hypothetical protein
MHFRLRADDELAIRFDGDVFIIGQERDVHVVVSDNRRALGQILITEADAEASAVVARRVNITLVAGLVAHKPVERGVARGLDKVTRPHRLGS